MKAGKTTLFSVKDVAEHLKLSEQRIKQLIYEDRLVAQKIGNQWIINKEDLRSVEASRESNSINRKSSLK